MSVVMVTADDVCRAVESSLVANVPAVLAESGLSSQQFKAPSSWRQTPTLEALRKAMGSLPAGAITSPGLADRPERNAWGFDAVFRVEVGVFDRGDDWETTANRVRSWAAVVRTAAFVDASLGGLADGVVWVSESYRRLLDDTSNRTLGMCAVEFDVRVADVLTFDSLPNPSNPPVGVVAKTAAAITTRSLT